MVAISHEHDREAIAHHPASEDERLGLARVRLRRSFRHSGLSFCSDGAADAAEDGRSDAAFRDESIEPGDRSCVRGETTTKGGGRQPARTLFRESLPGQALAEPMQVRYAPEMRAMRRHERASDRIFATRALPGAGLDRARRGARVSTRGPSARRPRRERLAERAAGADGLLCLLTDRIDAALLARCPRLRAISSVSVGVDHVDLAAATARGIPVGHTPGVLTETTADLAFALLLAAARRVAEGDRFVRAGEWTPARVWEPDMLLGRDVHGATLGLVGLGAIGQAVARRAQGFGMRVLAWSRTPAPASRASSS